MSPFWSKWFTPKKPAHLRTGEWGEREAERLLKKKGFKILARNVRFGNDGELDLVIRSKTTLIFVEVKTRKDETFGRPASAIDKQKKKNLRSAARTYMKRLRRPPERFRFDVVEVIGTPDTGLTDIRHVIGAFPIGGGFA